MAIQFTNSRGEIDLAMIRDEDVETLSDEQKEALSVFIDAVTTKKKASERLKAARERVHASMAAEDEALRLHLEASPPPTAQQAHAAAVAAYQKSH